MQTDPMLPGATLTLPLKGNGDRERAIRKARDLSRELGFQVEAEEEIALVVTELATNGFKYGAGTAEIELSVLGKDAIEGLKIEYSAPAANMPATPDSPMGGLGIGLDVIRNHVDSFSVDPNDGMRVTASKRLPAACMPRLAAEISVVTLPAAGERANGDGFFVDRVGCKVWMIVWDVLGHGQGAQDVSVKARREFQSRRGWDVGSLFERCQLALCGTRGMAVAALTLDLSTGEGVYSGVGNVETRYISARQKLALVPRPGILGKTGQKTRTQDFSIKEPGILIMASDGISLRHVEEDVKSVENAAPWAIADLMVRERARPADDKTILVSRIRLVACAQNGKRSAPAGDPGGNRR